VTKLLRFFPVNMATRGSKNEVGHSDVKDETSLKLYVTRMNLLFDLGLRDSDIGSRIQ